VITPPPRLWEDLRSRVRAWRRIGASPQVLSWIRHGVRPRWKAGPPAPFHLGASTLDPEASEWWEKERARAFSTGALEPATSRNYVSRAFVVPKTDSTGQQTGWRLVVDLRRLNSHCRPMVCRYETLKKLRTFARRGDWMVSWDLQDGYHHLSIHPSARKYFTFLVNGEYLQCAALPFGWNNSPAIFTKLLRPVVQFLRSPPPTPGTAPSASLLAAARRGIRVLPYLDDFLALFRSREEATVGVPRIRQLLETLGLRTHPRKCHWEPTQRLVHLGLEVDTVEGVFRVTPSRQRKLSTLAVSLRAISARSSRRVPAKTLAKFCGLAQSCTLALPVARLYLRALYDSLELRVTWGSTVPLSRQALRDLSWWASDLSTELAKGGLIWLRSETATLHCDSSSTAWGGVLNGRMPVRGSWADSQIPWHITLKELVAVRLTVTHFLQELTGRRVLLFEDNQAVVAALTTLTSQSPAMMAELRALWLLLHSASIDLRAVYIRSAANVWADDLSRRIDPWDYSVTPSLFRRLMRLWGPCTVDRFAAPHNRMLPRFNSRIPLPGAEATDAFSQSWAGESNWLHPPLSLLPEVVARLETSGARAVVVAPHWPAQSWFNPLCRLAAAIEPIAPSDLVRGPACPSLPPAASWLAFWVPGRLSPSGATTW
jgi:hypothetical protein